MATFYNQATLTYNGRTVSSNIATGEITDALTAAKTAVRDVYSPGDSLVYAVSMVNSGTAPLTGLTLIDDLGAYDYEQTQLVPLTYIDGTVQYYVNGILQPAPVVTLTSPLTITGLSIPAAGNAVIIYETALNSFAPVGADGSITNTAEISSEAKTVLATASETVTAAQAADLSISKSVSPIAVTGGGTLTYTFIIENTGNTAASATDSISVTDVFDPALSGVTVTYNGTAWTEGVEYTYDEDTATLVTTPGAITVPAAVYTQGTDGSYTVEPGTSTLTVEGTI